MKLRLIALLAAACVALFCFGTVAAAGPILDAALDRYPGAVRSVDEHIAFDTAGDGGLSRQAIFMTDDEIAAVRGWYAQRLGIGPSSTQYATGGDCSLLTQADWLYRLEHTVVVVICARPNGTRVVVNEKLLLWP